MDGLFFSFISSPAEQDPGGGLRSPRKDRGGSASDRSGLGAVRRVTAQQTPVAAEADRLRAAGAWSKTAMEPRPCACLWIAAVRGGVRWLAEQERRLQAARRTSDLGREEPAYAARISRNMDAFNRNSGDSSHTTGPSRACICKSSGSGVGMSAIGGGSLGRALNLSGD